MTLVFDKAITSPTFIGRAAQLAAFDRLLAQISPGHSQVVYVAGEAGIGKSRLVAEVRARAEQHGWQTVQGACFEPDVVLPYAPLIDLLRTHLARRSLSDVWTLLGPWAPEFVKLLPELALLLTDLQPTPRLDPEAEKRRLFDALVYFLGSFMQGQASLGHTSNQADKVEPPSQLRPLLLIIEDLHWCDGTSLEFLRYLARRLAKQPLLLLLTFRNDEIHAALQQFLAALDREQRPVEVALSKFTPTEVDALLRSIFDLQRPVRSAFLDRLYRLTEGNPFFIEEVLKVLVGTGDIFYAEGQWDRKPLTDLQIPRTLQDAVQRRTVQLSPAARQVLNLAAVAGRRFDFALLQALTGYDEAALLGHIKELLAAQLLIEAVLDQFAFRHALIRQAIYADLLARERKAIHRRIGETMERLAGSAPNAGQAIPWADLAYQFYVGEVWDKALAYAQAAGEQAQAFHAPTAAVEHFTHALDAAQRLVASTSDQLSTAVVMRLHSARGRAYETLGEFEAARTDLETALHLAQGTDDRKAEWQALLALGELWAARNYRQTEDYLRRALDLARILDDPAILAQCLNRMGNWYVNAEQPGEGLNYHQEALAIFQALNHQAGLAVTSDLIGLTHWLSGNMLQAVINLQRAVILFRQLGERRTLSSTLALLAARSAIYESDIIISPSCSTAESLHECEQAVQIARDIGWRAGEAHALMILGRIVAATGDYRHALTIARQALDLSREIGHHQWMCQVHMTFGLLYLDLLAVPLARQHFERALVPAQATGSLFLLRVVTGMLAFSCVLQQEFTRAEDVLNVVSNTAASELTMAQRWVWLGRAELALASGDAVGALGLVEQLIATTPNIEQAGICGVPRLALLKGRVLATLARPEEAEIALQNACEGAATKNLQALLWRTQVTLGHLYQTQGRYEDANRTFAAARTLIEELATQIPDEPSDLEGISLRKNFLHQANAMLPSPPRLTSRQAMKQAVAGLTAREVAVAIEVAQGKSNRAVAQTLVVSERTVETHISNILSKLGFSSRRQLVAWVVEKKLAKAENATHDNEC